MDYSEWDDIDEVSLFLDTIALMIDLLHIE